MRWALADHAVIDAGVKQPAGARTLQLLWPVWILPCDVDERVTFDRGLDVFEEALLALVRAGVREIAEIARIVGLHKELAAFIRNTLVEQRLLDERSGELTPSGAALLDRQLDTDATERRTTAYLVLDAVTGEPMPRTLERVETTDAPERAMDVPPADAYARTAPVPSRHETVDAVKRARLAAGEGSDVLAVYPSTQAEPCFLLTCAYQRSLTARAGARSPGWTIDDDACVSDPFGLVLRADRQTDALRDSAAAGRWGAAICKRLAPRADGDEAALAYAEKKTAHAASLRQRFPVLDSTEKALHAFATARALADIGEIRPALVELANALVSIFAQLALAHPWSEVVERLPLDESALELHLGEALRECWYGGDDDGRQIAIPRSTFYAVVYRKSGSVRCDFMYAVLAAAENVDHPLRAMIARDADGKQSTWLDDLDALADGRNIAAHVSDGSIAESLSRASFERYTTMTEQALEALLGTREGVAA